MAEVPLHVVDASVALKWRFIEDHADQQAYDLLTDFVWGRMSLTAPNALPYEYAGVLRRRVNQGHMAELAAQRSYAQFLAYRIPFRDPDGLHHLAYDNVVRYSIRFFDALYLALAQIEGCRVITYDRPFYDAMPPNHRLWLPDYQSPPER